MPGSRTNGPPSSDDAAAAGPSARFGGRSVGGPHGDFGSFDFAWPGGSPTVPGHGGCRRVDAAGAGDGDRVGVGVGGCAGVGEGEGVGAAVGGGEDGGAVAVDPGVGVGVAGAVGRGVGRGVGAGVTPGVGLGMGRAVGRGAPVGFGPVDGTATGPPDALGEADALPVPGDGGPTISPSAVRVEDGDAVGPALPLGAALGAGETGPDGDPAGDDDAIGEAVAGGLAPELATAPSVGVVRGRSPDPPLRLRDTAAETIARLTTPSATMRRARSLRTSTSLFRSVGRSPGGGHPAIPW
jgi:hypothetical protein